MRANERENERELQLIGAASQIFFFFFFFLCAGPCPRPPGKVQRGRNAKKKFFALRASCPRLRFTGKAGEKKFSALRASCPRPRFTGKAKKNVFWRYAPCASAQGSQGKQGKKNARFAPRASCFRPDDISDGKAIKKNLLRFALCAGLLSTELLLQVVMFANVCFFFLFFFLCAAPIDGCILHSKMRHKLFSRFAHGGCVICFIPQMQTANKEEPGKRTILASRIVLASSAPSG